jgi:hypothetical protein
MVLLAVPTGCRKLHGILSSEKANNSPGLCPVKDRSNYLDDTVTRGDQQPFFKRILHRRNYYAI